MAKIHNTTDGFGSLPILIFLLIVLLVTFTGITVYKHISSKPKPVDSARSISAEKSLSNTESKTLQIYNYWLKNWGYEAGNTIVYKHPEWFTADFTNAVKQGGGSRTPNNGGLPLACAGNGLIKPDSITAEDAQQKDNKRWVVNVRFIYPGNANPDPWAVYMKQINKTWRIDGLECNYLPPGTLMDQ
jgi:hypothetical protein